MVIAMARYNKGAQNRTQQALHKAKRDCSRPLYRVNQLFSGRIGVRAGMDVRG